MIHNSFKKYLSILLTLPLLISCEEKVIFDFEEELAAELVLIDQFIDQNDMTVQTHESGARYHIYEPGTGDLAQDGDTAFFSFHAYSLDSTLIGTNIDSIAAQHGIPTIGNGPIRWVVGSQAYFYNFGGIFELATELMNENSKACFIAPSYLGHYGAIFMIEMDMDTLKRQ